MGWGIVYPPYSVLNMGAAQPPVPTTRWVYNFNGVDSYIQLNQIWEPVDTTSFKVAFRLSGVLNNTTEDHILDYDLDLYCKIVINPSGNIFALVSDGTFWKIQLLSNTKVDDGGDYFVELEKSGGLYTLKINGNTEATTTNAATVTPRLSLIGRRSNGTNILKGSVYDVSLTADGVTQFYSINDRTFGAGAVIANTGTGPDATGVNLLESGWTEIPL